jgi:flavin-dependent dehydrogenase
LAEKASCDDRVDIFVGETVAPGFFGWSVPAEDGILRVGVGVLPPHQPSTFLGRILSERFPHAHVQSRCGGWIPLTPAPQLAAANALLVGDAAGQVKPLSGGGLYTGGACAQIAGEEAARLARAGEHAHDVLTDYPRRCQEAIGREQAFGRSIRHHLARLKDEDTEAAAAALDDRPFLQFLADHADIDCFHRLPDQLASEPRLWATLLRIVPLLGSSTG